MTVFYRLGALGAYHGALLGLCLDLFGGILVSLGAILATLWPSLGYLRLYLGCLVLGQPWKPFVMNVIVIFFGLIIFKICSPVCVCVSHDSVSFMSEFHEVLYPDMIGWVSGCGHFHIES